PATAEGGGKPASLRVRSEVLDSLMSRAAELVLARSQLRAAVSSHDCGALEAADRALGRVATDLQRSVLEARMQPLSAVLSGIPRLARDAARACGKKIDVAIEGADVELDRAVLDRLAEPLAHIVRNSIAHGIEAPEARAASGKSPQGTIRLAATQRNGRVELAISDDGRGFDLEAMRRRAAERGIRSEEELAAMSDAEVLDLAFLPNFSTAQSVSNLAGRGVGLDAVRAAVSGFGGTVELRSQSGSGASVILRLPLTLAILDALILRAGDILCAAPESYVERILRLDARRLGELLRVREAEYLEIGGEIVPLVRLERVFERARLEPAPEDGDRERGRRPRGARSAVLVSTGAYRYALLVDSAEEVEEIVLKPLARGLQEGAPFAGTSVLSQGRIALVLDLAAVARRARVPPVEAQAVPSPPKRGSERAEEREPLLLLGGFEGSSYALPLGAVRHIERIRAAQVEKVGDRFFLALGGRPIEVFPAGEPADAASLRDYGHLFVVVLDADGRSVGILSPRVPDAVELWTEGEPLSGTGLSAHGVVLAGGRAAALLEPKAFAASGLRQAAASGSGGQIPGTILVVEDSGFLRSKICALLRRAGYETRDAADGRRALDALRSGGQKIDAVVTDLEMPELDGFALAAAIREDPRLRHLPVIALSALTGDEHVARAYEAGVDEYLFKLDPDQLLEAVSRHLSLAKRRGEPRLETVREGGQTDGAHDR
ncbi:MAG: hybrid sensor histidine kinase/response regulator, partial [Planctomycetota bacterium]